MTSTKAVTYKDEEANFILCADPPAVDSDPMVLVLATLSSALSDRQHVGVPQHS